jgi:predicted nucleic acid-binding protein
MPSCNNELHYESAISNPCLSCTKKDKGCTLIHTLIDSSIFIAAYLEEREQDRANSILGSIGTRKKRMGYMTTVRVGHVIRKFYEEYRALETKRQRKTAQIHNRVKLDDSFKVCMEKIRGMQIIDVNETAIAISCKLRDKGCRMEHHDTLNVGAAIANKLSIEASDNDLEDDSAHIKEVAREQGFRHMKINGE